MLLEQGLLSNIRCLSKDGFLFQQDGAPEHCSCYTVAYLHFYIPEFIKLEKLPSSSLNLNPVDYLVRRALQQMVYHQKFSDIDWLKCVLFDCWTQLSWDTFNQMINQSKVKQFKQESAHRQTDGHTQRYQTYYLPFYAVINYLHCC